jgi:hypothetical protein
LYNAELGNGFAASYKGSGHAHRASHRGAAGSGEDRHSESAAVPQTRTELCAERGSIPQWPARTR